MSVENFSSFCNLQAASIAINEYIAHPSIRGGKELSAQIPSLKPQIASLWTSLPFRERIGIRLAYEYQELRDKLPGRGEKRLVAHGVTAFDAFPDQDWDIIDGFLNGDFKGDLPRSIMVDPRSAKRLKIHDVDGNTFSVVKVDDPVTFGADLRTYNHNRDNTHIHRTSQLMNSGRSLSNLYDPQRVAGDLYHSRFWLRAVESMRQKEMLQPI